MGHLRFSCATCIASSHDKTHNRIPFCREGRTVVSVVELRFQARGLLFLNGAELREGGGEQEPVGLRDLSFVLLFGTPTHGVNTD